MVFRNTILSSWSFLMLFLIAGSGNLALAQNIAINTTGTAAASTNMLEVTQSSAAANMVAIYAINSGASAGTGYGLYATKTGAGTTNIAAYFSASGGTNNYGMIVPLGGGSVGIGTSAPSAQLHVDNTGADATFRVARSAGSNFYVTSQTSGSVLGTAGATSLDLRTNNTPGRIYIMSTGNVGINNITPQVQAHITSTVTAASASHPYRAGLMVEGDQNTLGGRIALKQSDRAANIVMFRHNGTSAAPTAIVSGNELGGLSFGGYDGTLYNSFVAMQSIASENWAAGAPGSHGTHITLRTLPDGTNFGTEVERVRITSGGNVGIATTTPGVVPNWTVPSTMRVVEITGDGATENVFTDGGLLLTNNRPTPTVGDQNGVLLFGHRNNPGNWAGVIASNLTGAGGASGFGAEMRFYTKPDNVAGHLQRMVIDDDGNVGIGTAAPLTKLDIVGSSANDAFLARIENTTSSGELLLGVNHLGNEVISLRTDATSGFLAVSNSSGVRSSVVHATNSYFLGNVGVGTSSPASKLHVSGGVIQGQGLLETAYTAPATVGNATFINYNFAANNWAGMGGYTNGAFWYRAQDHVWWTPGTLVGSPTNVMIFNQAGNLGLGTTSPTSKLTISGGYIQGTAETWGHQARTQGLIIMPEGTVTDDGAGNVTFSATLIVMNPLSGSYFRIASGTYAFGTWGYMWVELPPTGTRATTVTPTISAWSDGDRAYDGRDRLLIGQRKGNGKVYFRFGVTY